MSCVMSEETCNRSGRRPGFGLVETIFAMMIAAVGVLALGSVMGVTANRQALSASRLEIAALAESKMDQLRFYASSQTADTLKLVVGGSLISDVANYNDLVTSARGRDYKRRWNIVPGVFGTRDVTIRVLPVSPSRLELAYFDVKSLFLID